MSFNFKGNELPKNNSIEGPILSKEHVIAEKFSSFIKSGKFPDLELTPTNVENIKKAIISLGARLAPGNFNINEVIDELKKSGVIKPSLQPKQIKKEEEVVVYKTESEEKLKGLTLAEISEEQLRTKEANLLHEEVHKKGIFKDSAELNKTYDKSLSLIENKSPKTALEFLEFAKAGLIKSEKSLSPEEVTKKDFDSTEEKLKIFADNAPKDPILLKKYLEAKKIATIVERSLAYCCTEGSWYGERVKFILTSSINDFRGIDEVVLIEKDNDKHDVLGLGVDATYRGLKSDLFEKKFFSLLQSIRDGHKTKIKYFKDHNGKMMKEFAIPRIVLSFNMDDVKEFVDIIKNIENADQKERIKNSYLKAKVMSQIMNSCKILARFAEDSKNNIFRDYYNVINSIKELSWENEEMKDLINIDENDEVSKHLKDLIEKFEDLEELRLEK